MSSQPEPKLNDETEEVESDEKRKKRQEEWGQQFDMWLIRAARRKQLIELCLLQAYPGVTRDSNLVDCIPIRIDRYMIEVSIGGSEVWLNKQWIVGCKELAGRERSEEE